MRPTDPPPMVGGQPAFGVVTVDENGAVRSWSSVKAATRYATRWAQRHRVSVDVYAWRRARRDLEPEWELRRTVDPIDESADA